MRLEQATVNSQAIYTDKLGFVLFSRVGGIKQTTTTQAFTYSGMTASIMCSVLPYSISNMSLTANTLVAKNKLKEIEDTEKMKIDLEEKEKGMSDRKTYTQIYSFVSPK